MDFSFAIATTSVRESRMVSPGAWQCPTLPQDNRTPKAGRTRFSIKDRLSNPIRFNNDSRILLIINDDLFGIPVSAHVGSDDAVAGLHVIPDLYVVEIGHADMHRSPARPHLAHDKNNLTPRPFEAPPVRHPPPMNRHASDHEVLH